MSQPIGIGLAGFGTVGAGVYKNLAANGDLLAQRLGAHFEVRRIAVRDLKKPRTVAAPAELFTANADDLISDPQHSHCGRTDGRNRDPARLREEGDPRRARSSSPATRRCSPSTGRRFFSCGPGAQGAGLLRGGGRGRHPDHQGDPRSASSATTSSPSTASSTARAITSSPG